MACGKIKLELEPVSVQALFNDLAFMFEDRLKEKSLKLSLNINSPTEDLSVLADQNSLLNEVFANLVSNGIKFSHQEGILTLNGRAEGGKVIISVKDMGVGMSPHLAEKILDPSVATTRLGTANEKGTGFGLPTVKMFVEQYQGEIHVTSTLGEGCTFDVILRQAT